MKRGGVFPYAKLNQSGDRVIENGLLATTFSGYGLGNAAFGSGPDERWEFPTAAERPYSYARTDWAPTGLNGFYTWHGEITAAVTNKALTSNVATLTTGSGHGFSVGDRVTVSNVGTPFDGTFTITSVPSTTTFSYAASGTDVTSTSATGSATIEAGARIVNDLPDASGTADADGFNVPGNVNFNADRDIDYVVLSSESPSA